MHTFGGIGTGLSKKPRRLAILGMLPYEFIMTLANGFALWLSTTAAVKEG
jgi:hypothetical protein